MAKNAGLEIGTRKEREGAHVSKSKGKPESGKPDYEMRCIIDVDWQGKGFVPGVMRVRKWGESQEADFLRMSLDRLKVETAKDEEICVVFPGYVGRVEDTAKRLRAFLWKWETETAKLERRRVEKKKKVPPCLQKAYGRKNDPLTVIHAAACSNADNDPQGRDETLTLRLIGREVVKQMREGKNTFFKDLATIAQSFSDTGNFIGGLNAKTNKGKMIFVFNYLVEREKGRLPSCSKIQDELDRAGHRMDEKQFRDDCKALGMDGLPTC